MGYNFEDKSMGVETIGTPSLWIGFLIFVFAMLALDLGVIHRKAHEVSLREAAVWSVIWVTLALIFNYGVYTWFGPVRGLEFLTGYVVEKALSVDNIFVFVLLFSIFKVPAAYQHRVLFWGILGALIMRAIFIALGAALIASFHWVIYLFGVFLVITGIKMLLHKGAEMDPAHNPVFRFFKRIVPAVPEYHGSSFFVRIGGKWFATPLFLVLIAIELTDLIFAVDSVPAIFGVTEDPFIVFTSNIFAILGLRALYFLLAGVMDKFHYLKVGLSLVLVFVGLKMLGAGFYKIPIAVSLGVISLLIGGSVLASFIWPRHATLEETAEK
jgi:tellurite resistance protein TerC